MGFIIFLVFLMLGLFFGRYAEAKHFNSIKQREVEYKQIHAFSSRFPPAKPVAQVSLVSGNVVVSVDYFKRFLSGLRALIGGRVKSYETLIERARREAILRMKEDAIAQGYEIVFNVKLETASITKGQGQSVGCVEVFAYGTGIKY